VLLVVAADEGVDAADAREHLEIVDLPKSVAGWWF